MSRPHFTGMQNCTKASQAAKLRYDFDKGLLEEEIQTMQKEKAEFEEALRHVDDETEEDWDYEAEYERYMGQKYRQHVPTTVPFTRILKFTMIMKRIGKQRTIRIEKERKEKEQRIAERMRRQEEEATERHNAWMREQEEERKRKQQEIVDKNTQAVLDALLIPPDPESKCCISRAFGGGDCNQLKNFGMCCCDQHSGNCGCLQCRISRHCSG